MAEALGIASGVAGLLSLTLEISKTTSDYVDSARSASSTIRSFDRELATLQLVLERLQKDIEASQSPQFHGNAKLLQQIDIKTLENCSQDLIRTKNKLNTNPGSSLRRAVAWPFKETETRKLVESLQRHRATFDSAINIETYAVSNEVLQSTKRNADAIDDLRTQGQTVSKRLKEIGDSQDDLLDGASSINAQTKAIAADTGETLRLHQQSSDESRIASELKALKWLSQRDTSVVHNTARKSHQAGTGQWFIDSAVFRTWLGGSHPVFWLYGGPGSGKTVLTSTVIEHSMSERNYQNYVAYYYFTFTDVASLSTVSFLRSVIRQLVSQSDHVPHELIALHRRSIRSGHLPSQQDLTALLNQLIAMRHRTVLIIDAIDESSESEDVLAAIIRLVRQFPRKLQVFMASRFEKRIADSLEDMVSSSYVEFSIKTASLDHDILQHIRQELETNSVLRRKTLAQKAKIESTLMAKADGMFRWVSCQIDALRKCRTAVALTAALQSLPAGLEETYERILDRISDDDKPMTFAGLQFLLHARRELSINEFAEAITTPPTEKFDIELHRLCDPSDILEICSGLISVGPSTSIGRSNVMIVRLGHLSVRDYLLSKWIPLDDPINTPKPGLGKLDEAHAHREIAMRCIQYMQGCPAEGKLVQLQDLREYPFLEYCAYYWHVHASQRFKAATKDENLGEVISQFLQESNPAFLNWLRIAMPHAWAFTQSFAPFRTLKDRDVHSATCYAQALGFEDVLDGMLRERNVDVDTKVDSIENIVNESMLSRPRKFGLAILKTPCENRDCRLFRVAPPSPNNNSSPDHSPDHPNLSIEQLAMLMFSGSRGVPTIAKPSEKRRHQSDCSTSTHSPTEPDTAPDRILHKAPSKSAGPSTYVAAAAQQPELDKYKSPERQSFVPKIISLTFFGVVKHINTWARQRFQWEVFIDDEDEDGTNCPTVRRRLFTKSTHEDIVQMMGCGYPPCVNFMMETSALPSATVKFFNMRGTLLHNAIIRRSLRDVMRLLYDGADEKATAIIEERWPISTAMLVLLTNPFDNIMLSMLVRCGASSGGDIGIPLDTIADERANPTQYLIMQASKLGLSNSLVTNIWLRSFISFYQPFLGELLLVAPALHCSLFHLTMLCGLEWPVDPLSLFDPTSDAHESSLRTLLWALRSYSVSTLELALFTKNFHLARRLANDPRLKTDQTLSAIFDLINRLLITGKGIQHISISQIWDQPGKRDEIIKALCDRQITRSHGSNGNPTSSKYGVSQITPSYIYRDTESENTDHRRHFLAHCQSLLRQPDLNNIFSQLLKIHLFDPLRRGHNFLHTPKYRSLQHRKSSGNTPWSYDELDCVTRIKIVEKVSRPVHGHHIIVDSSALLSALDLAMPEPSYVGNAREDSRPSTADRHYVDVDSPTFYPSPARSDATMQTLDST